MHGRSFLAAPRACRAVLLALAACGPSPPQGSASATDDATTAPVTSTTADATTTGAPTTSTSTTGTVTTDDGTFDTDMPVNCESNDGCPFDQQCVPVDGDPMRTECAPIPCTVWKQDCPDGQKCAAFGPLLAQTRCVPLAPTPKGPLEPCTAIGPFGDRTDDCDEWSVCWLVDGEDGGNGVCLPLCHPDDLACEPGSVCLYTSQDSELFKCVPLCDPLAQSCPGSSSCSYMDEFGFHCDWTIMPKGYGAPCGLSPCADGFMCALAEDVPGCRDQLCCTAFCDLNAPNTCPGAPAQQCIGYFQQVAPVGWEHVGICAVP